MSGTAIDLVYFDGCPNVDQARRNIREAVRASGADLRLREWDLGSIDAPPHLLRFGSPTVLVRGEDVTGPSGCNAALACRADGAPDVEVILRALGSNRGEE